MCVNPDGDQTHRLGMRRAFWITQTSVKAGEPIQSRLAIGSGRAGPALVGTPSDGYLGVSGKAAACAAAFPDPVLTGTPLS